MQIGITQEDIERFKLLQIRRSKKTIKVVKPLTAIPKKYITKCCMVCGEAGANKDYYCNYHYSHLLNETK